MSEITQTVEGEIEAPEWLGISREEYEKRIAEIRAERKDEPPGEE